MEKRDCLEVVNERALMLLGPLIFTGNLALSFYPTRMNFSENTGRSLTGKGRSRLFSVLKLIIDKNVLTAIYLETDLSSIELPLEDTKFI